MAWGGNRPGEGARAGQYIYTKKAISVAGNKEECPGREKKEKVSTEGILSLL